MSMDFDFKPSPHKPLVIMDGYSEAGRVYLHDGVRSSVRCAEIQRLWMASADLCLALEECLEWIKSETGHDGTSPQDYPVTRSARAALNKARSNQKPITGFPSSASRFGGM